MLVHIQMTLNINDRANFLQEGLTDSLEAIEDLVATALYEIDDTTIESLEVELAEK